MVYEDCLCEELGLRTIPFDRQVSASVVYKGKMGSRYRIDLIVDKRLVVELQSVEALISVHKSQVLTQLRLTNITLGLLLNFNVPTLVQGMKRVGNGPGVDLSLSNQ